MSHDHHSPPHGNDRDYFDTSAQDWDDDAKVERSRVVADAIRAAVTVDTSTRVLEYGAGTGLTTQHLASGELGPVTLADPSGGMRAVMEAKAQDGRLPASAAIVDLDLSSGEVPDDTWDLIVTVMTLHHIPDLDPVLEAFADVLAPDGHLCIVDLVAEDGSFHAHLDDFQGHDGFDRAGLMESLRASGFGPPTWEVVHSMEKDDEAYALFLAVASPSPSSDGLAGGATR